MVEIGTEHPPVPATDTGINQNAPAKLDAATQREHHLPCNFHEIGLAPGNPDSLGMALSDYTKSFPFINSET